MDWADYSIRIAPNVVALIVAVGSFIGGRVVLDAKDEVIKAKQAQIELLERFRPKGLVEEIDALHAFYERKQETIQRQADEKIAEVRTAKVGDEQRRAQLQEQVEDLQRQLTEAQEGRKAAESLAARLRSPALGSWLKDLAIRPNLTAVDVLLAALPDNDRQENRTRQWQEILKIGEAKQEADRKLIDEFERKQKALEDVNQKPKKGTPAESSNDGDESRNASGAS